MDVIRISTIWHVLSKKNSAMFSFFMFLMINDWLLLQLLKIRHELLRVKKFTMNTSATHPPPDHKSKGQDLKCVLSCGVILFLSENKKKKNSKKMCKFNLRYVLPSAVEVY